jgi:energy-coupling factor transport system permease protein
MLSRLHPLPKLALSLIWIIASLVVFDLQFQLVTLGFVVALLWVVERVPLWKILLLIVPFALFGMGFLTTSVLFQRDSGFAVQMAQEQGAVQPDLAPGLVLFARVLACGMISALFALTTDAGRLVRALMQHLLLPAPVGFAILQAMHLVPDLGRELQSLRMARAMRNGHALRRIPRPSEIVALVIPLLAFGIRRATRAAIAMEARGLHPGRARSQLPQPGITRFDMLASAVATVALLAALMLGSP